MTFQDGMKITILFPAPLVPVIALLLIGLISAGVLAARRQAVRWRQMAYEAQTARARLAELAGRPPEASLAADAYRHFIRNASHEISNPLQSIQTHLDNMAHCTPDEAGRWRQYHGLITAEMRRLAALTDSLRLLSQLETPDAPLVREPVNLKAVIEGVIMAQSEAAEARQVRLRYVGPERPARVLGDRDHLSQVLLNLANNSIKYAKPEGGSVIFSVQEEGDRQWVRVSDDGIGIAAEDLQHICEEAYRAPDAHSFRRKGSGLGLAVVKRIIEQHDGQLRIESQPGVGTKVSFELPIYIAK
jgi:two-component system phosphate regulon sensor histidine kinase PhoR